MSAFRFLRCCCTTHRPSIPGLSLFQKPLGQAFSPLVSSFLPTLSRTMSEYKLSSVTTLPAKPGDKVEAEIEGLEGAKVLLVNSAGTIQAIGPKCTHYGAPLVKGVLTANGRITCPWHGACFNTVTGDVEDAPALDSLPIFSVSERDGAIYVTGDEATLKAGRRRPGFQCSTTSGGEKVVVVGGGSGAVGAVEGLRSKGFRGAITIIGNEGYLPIDRPKLSKALIDDPAKLVLRDEDWYKSGSIDMIQDEVVDVDFGTKTVATKQGSKYGYTKLILATGGTPRNLPLPGFKTLENIFVLRSVHDVKKIVAAIGDKGKNIVIIGSSFIGMEVANATCNENTVSVVGMENAPLERVLGEEIGKAVQKGLEAKGVKFYMSAGVEKAESSPSAPKTVGSVALKDGTSLEADLVILGVGVAPATAYLRNNTALQLLPDKSIKTDEAFRVVGLTDVYAIGDIATYPFHGPGGEGMPVRIEHWNVAQNSGRTVASHIVSPLARPRPFIPVFWSALGAQLRYCGNTQGSGWDHLIIQGNPGEGKFAAFYCKGDVVVAVATMGMDPVMVQAAELLRLGKMPSKGEIQGGLDILNLDTPLQDYGWAQSSK